MYDYQNLFASFQPRNLVIMGCWCWNQPIFIVHQNYDKKA